MNEKKIFKTNLKWIKDFRLRFDYQFDHVHMCVFVVLQNCLTKSRRTTAKKKTVVSNKERKKSDWIKIVPTVEDKVCNFEEKLSETNKRNIFFCFSVKVHRGILGKTETHQLIWLPSNICLVSDSCAFSFIASVPLWIVLLALFPQIIIARL